MRNNTQNWQNLMPKTPMSVPPFEPMCPPFAVNMTSCCDMALGTCPWVAKVWFANLQKMFFHIVFVFGGPIFFLRFSKEKQITKPLQTKTTKRKTYEWNHSKQLKQKTKFRGLEAGWLTWAGLAGWLAGGNAISSPRGLASSCARFLLKPYSNLMQYPLLAALPPPVFVSN